jgi:hypothetical protein
MITIYSFNMLFQLKKIIKNHFFIDFNENLKIYNIFNENFKYEMHLSISEGAI